MTVDKDNPGAILYACKRIELVQTCQPTPVTLNYTAPKLTCMSVSFPVIPDGANARDIHLKQQRIYAAPSISIKRLTTV
jgi:hypothetical protein